MRIRAQVICEFRVELFWNMRDRYLIALRYPSMKLGY